MVRSILVLRGTSWMPAGDGPPASLTRLLLGMLAALLMLGWLHGAAMAQAAQPAAPPEKVKQLLELLNDPSVKAWLESQPAAPAAAADSTAQDDVSNVETRIRNHIGGLKNALLRLPQEIANAARVTTADVNAGRPGTVILILAVLIAVGSAVEWLLRRRLGRRRAAVETTERPLYLLSELIPLLGFALASAGLFLVFDWPPLLRRVVLTILLATILFRLVLTVARLLLAPEGTTAGGQRLIDIDDAGARFWFRRVQRLAGIFIFGWAVARLMTALSFSHEAVLLIAYLFGLGLLAVGVEAVWRRPAAAAASPVKTWLLTAYLVLLWLIWVAGFVGILWVGLYLLLLPRAVRGVGWIVETLAGGRDTTTLYGRVIDVLIVRGARAVVIAAAVAWLAFVWRIRAETVGENALIERLVGGALHGIIVLLIADLLWQLSKVFIAHRLEVSQLAGGTPDEVARRGRLRTLLPIFRNALAVFIAAVAGLTILSGMGVAIGPLIAGAGIFGVAIGFGSQTLVKDVLSGVFFMLDDAFRVGEYIQSGSYKGTVEGFSLRSVRLRHQRGPIFTVPFGQLGAVQNMSRDWVIEKMTLTVTYDSDVELARKLVKKIGQQLAEDPEFAASTLQPLKMQGVDSFGDLGIVLRMKLMTKPGEQFSIKRKALVMIKKAFDENNIKLATPTVQVAGGGDEGAAAAETLRRKKLAEAAAAGEG